MFKKIFLVGIAIILVGAVLFFAIDGSAKKDEDFKTVAVTKGSIIDKALAVGKIEPRLEISVKSKISGIVKKAYVDIGDRVKVGDPLFDIAPDPTPIEFAEAKRDVEIRQVTFDNAKREYDRAKSLKEKDLLSPQEFDTRQTFYEEARLRLQIVSGKTVAYRIGEIECGQSRSGQRHQISHFRNGLVQTG